MIPSLLATAFSPFWTDWLSSELYAHAGGNDSISTRTCCKYQDFCDIFSSMEVDALPPLNHWSDSQGQIAKRTIVFIIWNRAISIEGIPWGNRETLFHPSSQALSFHTHLGGGVVKKKSREYELAITGLWMLLPKETASCCHSFQNYSNDWEQILIYTNLDLHGAHNLVRTWEGNGWKTAFGIRYGHCKPIVSAVPLQCFSIPWKTYFRIWWIDL